MQFSVGCFSAKLMNRIPTHRRITGPLGLVRVVVFLVRNLSEMFIFDCIPSGEERDVSRFLLSRRG